MVEVFVVSLKIGSHCITVDPRYLAYITQELNYNPEIILAGRRVNDNMTHYVVIQVVKTMIKKGIHVSGSNVLVLGITFKEHCPDIRNSKAIDIIRELKEFGCDIEIIDPWASSKQVYEEFDLVLKPVGELPIGDGKILVAHYDATVNFVAHREFQSYDFSAMIAFKKVIYDAKGLLPKMNVDVRL